MVRITAVHEAYPTQHIVLQDGFPTKAHAHAAIPRIARKGRYVTDRLAGDVYRFTAPAGGGAFVSIDRVED